MSYAPEFLFVPKESVKEYKSHLIWGQFKQIIGVEEFD